MNFPLRLPDDVRADMAAHAKAQGRSLNSMIVVVLRQFLAAQAAANSEPAGALSPNIPPAGRINPGEPR